MRSNSLYGVKMCQKECQNVSDRIYGVKMCQTEYQNVSDRKSKCVRQNLL